MEQRARLRRILDEAPAPSPVHMAPSSDEDETTWLTKIQAEDRKAFGTVEPNSDKAAAASLNRWAAC